MSLLMSKKGIFTIGKLVLMLVEKQLLMSLARTQFLAEQQGTTAEHRTHTLPVPSRYATFYATDAG